VGDTVYAVGSPSGLEGTFSAGIVSGVRQMRETKLIQITAPISPGSSGGPVLDTNGDVAGVAVATYRGGQNLNFAVPVRAIRTLLKAPRTLSKFTTPNIQDTKPAWTDFGEGDREAVYASHLELGRFGGISFSVQNKTPMSITDIRGLVILRDTKGEPVDTLPFASKAVVGPGLAARVQGVGGLVSGSIRFADKESTEVRILSMRVVSNEPPVTNRGEGFYVVRAGDTGASIAAMHGLRIPEIQALNPGVQWAKLRVGQRLRVK
jgi:hypothetical protein